MFRFLCLRNTTYEIRVFCFENVRHPLKRDWDGRGRLTPRAYFTIFLKAGDAENFGTFFAAIFIGLPV